MHKVYDVLLGNEVAGEAQVYEEGLYYRFMCSCRLHTDVMYRLIVSCQDKTADLGICVPSGDRFGLNCKLAVKHLGHGELKFSLVPNHAKMNDDFVPIRPQEPFQYLAYLKNAYLQKRGGEIGIALKGNGI